MNLAFACVQRGSDFSLEKFQKQLHRFLNQDSKFCP